MGRGEEEDTPTSGHDGAVPEDVADGRAAEPSEPAPDPIPHFTVVIADDGAATLDGVPVPVADGVTADAAVLDALQRYAHENDTSVTAAISDPAADYVALVEVGADGSSRLLDQYQYREHEQRYEAEGSAPAVFGPPDADFDDVYDDSGFGGPAAPAPADAPADDVEYPSEPANGPDAGNDAEYDVEYETETEAETEYETEYEAGYGEAHEAEDDREAAGGSGYDQPAEVSLDPFAQYMAAGSDDDPDEFDADDTDDAADATDETARNSGKGLRGRVRGIFSKSPAKGAALAAAEPAEPAPHAPQDGTEDDAEDEFDDDFEDAGFDGEPHFDEETDDDPEYAEDAEEAEDAEDAEDAEYAEDAEDAEAEADDGFESAHVDLTKDPAPAPHTTAAFPAGPGPGPGYDAGGSEGEYEGSEYGESEYAESEYGESEYDDTEYAEGGLEGVDLEGFELDETELAANDPEAPGEYGDDEYGEHEYDADEYPDETGVIPQYGAANHPAAGRAPAAAGAGRGKKEARQSGDPYQGPGLLHRPVVVGPVAVVVAALVIVPLVVIGGGGDSGDQDQSRSSSDMQTTAPPLPDEPTWRGAAPDESQSPSPTKTKKKKEKKKEIAQAPTTAPPPPPTHTEKPKVKKAPVVNAGSTVARLAGRHICYRVYLRGLGWQKIVCDGAVAGAGDTGREITALDISVKGGNGSAANAFMHDPNSTNGQGHWQPSWSAVKGDAQDIYVGSSKAGAPMLTGFAINIGSGQVCQEAKSRGRNWGAKACVNPRPAFIFGGTLDNDVPLESLKFTV